jgi:hypothetical protein
MILAGLVSLLSALLAGGGGPSAPEDSVRVTTIEERLIIRVPLAPRPRQRLSIRWEEEKGPKCIPADSIARAFLSGPGSIDILMRSRQLIRAKLDSDCDGLDFTAACTSSLRTGASAPSATRSARGLADPAASNASGPWFPRSTTRRES